MKFLYFFVMFWLLSGCTVLSQFEYDGAGNFNKPASCRNNKPCCRDRANSPDDFDAVVLFHLVVVDGSGKTVTSRLPGSTPLLMLRIRDEYFNADPVLRKELYRRGDFARLYQQYIPGDWTESDSGPKLETFAVFEVKSKIEEFVFWKIRLKFFAASEWLDIPINKTVKIIPGCINYLGTLSIEVAATGESSDKTIKQAYFKYDTAIVEGNTYRTQWRLEYKSDDFTKDKDVIDRSYPDLIEKYQNAFQVIY